MQPHLTPIPAATQVASYREGSAYSYMGAFREAARALAGAELVAMLEDDPYALQDRGTDQLGNERLRLRQRYLALAVDHSMAAWVVRRLDAAYTWTAGPGMRAAILTYVLWPVHLRLLARTRGSRGWAALAMTATLTLALSSVALAGSAVAPPRGVCLS